MKSLYTETGLLNAEGRAVHAKVRPIVQALFDTHCRTEGVNPRELQLVLLACTEAAATFEAARANFIPGKVVEDG